MNIFAATRFHHISMYALVAGVLFSTCPANASNYVNKKHSDYFISSNLRKNFYKIEVQTVQYLNRQQSDVNGLVESFRGTSVYAYDLFTRAFCYGKGGVLDCQSFTYDCSLAVMSYLLAGQEHKAANILQVYRKEFYRDKNDMVGLYNSYRTDQVSRDGLILGIDGDRIHVGPTMWVCLAVLQYTAMTGDTQFLPFAIDMAKWAQSLNHYTFPDGQRGAVCMGSGWGPDWSMIYSTENNSDYYAVLIMLKDIYQHGDDKIKTTFKKKSYGLKDMDTEINGLKRWMREIVYNKERKYFMCGYNENGPDKTDALDNVSWVIDAYGPEVVKELGVDPCGLMDFADKMYHVTDTIKGEKIEGYDLTDPAGRNNPLRMIWFEGTGFHIIAMQAMAKYCQRMGMKDRAKEYREKAIKFSDQMDKAAQLIKLHDYALPYTSKCPAEKEVLLTFAYEWEIPRGHKGQWVSSMSSTTWRYFALLGFNPLVFDKDAVNYRFFSSK